MRMTYAILLSNCFHENSFLNSEILPGFIPLWFLPMLVSIAINFLKFCILYMYHFIIGILVYLSSLFIELLLKIVRDI